MKLIFKRLFCILSASLIYVFSCSSVVHAEKVRGYVVVKLNPDPGVLGSLVLGSGDLSVNRIRTNLDENMSRIIRASKVEFLPRIIEAPEIFDSNPVEHLITLKCSYEISDRFGELKVSRNAKTMLAYTDGEEATEYSVMVVGVSEYEPDIDDFKMPQFI